MRSTMFRVSRVVLVPAVLAFAACSSSDSSPTGDNGAGGSGSDGCPGTSCNHADSVCLAIADNTGTGKTQLRMTQLVTTNPPALTTQFFEDIVLNKNMRLAYDSCPIYGTGQFSWLLSWDDASGKVTVGGGPTVANEGQVKNGTCFLQLHDPTSGFDAAPVTVDSKIAADGTFDIAIDSIVIPIFLDASGSNYVLLPLHHVEMKNTASGRVTDDAGNPSTSGNCIGAYKSDALDPGSSCYPDDNFTFFDPGGELTGYITVDESDTVMVKDLQETLCVLLADDPSLATDGKPKRCARDANNHILAKGDWDSATNTAKDGGDAYRLVAQFAAAAVPIKGTATSFDCSDAK